jgi:hypothetical protein
MPQLQVNRPLQQVLNGIVALAEKTEAETELVDICLVVKRLDQILTTKLAIAASQRHLDEQEAELDLHRALQQLQDPEFDPGAELG